MGRVRLLVFGLILILVGVLASSRSQWVIVGKTPKAGGYSQAVVGTRDNIYILRGHQRDDPLHFWRCYVEGPRGMVSCTDEGLQGLPGSEDRARGIFRSGTALAYDGSDYIYALSGRFYTQQGSNALFRYDLEARTWSTLQNTDWLQGPGDALAFAEWQGKEYLYAFLGAAMSKDGRINTFNGFIRYDITSNNWIQLTKEDGRPLLPDGWECLDQGAALAWDSNGYIYALHGRDCDGKPTPDFARFNLFRQIWEPLSTQTPSLELPKPVSTGGSLAYDGERYLYALTGEEGYGCGKGLYRLDLHELKQWEALAELPCCIGDYVGNRLAFAKGYLLAWQGSPEGSFCDPDAINLTGEPPPSVWGKAIMQYQP